MYNKYFILEENFKIAFFNQNAILLDLKNDRFVLVDSEYTKMLKDVLSSSFIKNDFGYTPNNQVDIDHEYIGSLNSVLNELRAAGIITKADHKASNATQNYESAGVANLEWRLPRDESVKTTIMQFIYIYYELLVTYFTLKFFGIKGLINKAVTLHKRQDSQQVNINAFAVLSQLATYLNQTCAFLPFQTKCLEWAATYQRLAANHGIQCELIIGVQTFPFMSHAWVEYDKTVISDNENLPNELAVILRAPNISQNL